jgi:hypothetical protein
MNPPVEMPTTSPHDEWWTRARARLNWADPATATRRLAIRDCPMPHWIAFAPSRARMCPFDATWPSNAVDAKTCA